jgi:hypothetical protein
VILIDDEKQTREAGNVARFKNGAEFKLYYDANGESLVRRIEEAPPVLRRRDSQQTVALVVPAKRLVFLINTTPSSATYARLLIRGGRVVAQAAASARLVADLRAFYPV